MVTLSVMVEREEDGRFMARCPGLPGCVGQGRTVEQAMEQLHSSVYDFLIDAIEVCPEVANFTLERAC